MIDIAEAMPLGNKKLLVKFKDYPEKCIVDMSEFLESWQNFKLAKELDDEVAFQNFKVDHGAILWANGFDISPEYIFFIAHKSNQKYQALFKEWGYIK
jgi:hypothetical protein